MELSRPQHLRSDFASCCRRADFWAKSIAAMSTASLARCGSEKFRHWLSTDRRVTFAAKWLLCARSAFALVAQLDRASDFESEGREFESLRARQKNQRLESDPSISCFLEINVGKRIRRAV